MRNTCPFKSLRLERIRAVGEGKGERGGGDADGEAALNKKYTD